MRMNLQSFSLYPRWGIAILIMVGFAFFELGKSENASGYAITYLLLTAPEIIDKVRFAMGKSDKA